jgi:hypothetical protein
VLRVRVYCVCQEITYLSRHIGDPGVMCHADEHWFEALPLVLLGIRSAWKEDLKTLSAELVYGSLLWLPGEFLRSFPRRMHRHHRLRVPAEGPHWKASAPYQHPGMLRHPRSFSRTWPPPRMSFYGMVPSEPRMSATAKGSQCVTRFHSSKQAAGFRQCTHEEK